MTKDEFLSLPASVALGILLDGSAKLGEIVANTEKPRGPLMPKFDRRIYRKGGFVWASESSLESLTYWLGKKREGAASGSEWAAKDAKEAEQLARWVAYRTWYPATVWLGTRGDNEGVRAAAPSKSPKLHATEPREAAPAPANRGDAYEDAGEGDDVYPNF
jgi:hypothetical protein